ncbi:tetratricopeptide repeat protein, partial [Nocardiopsis sp. LOL_012]|uniref:tetratricopeptide repeat protein n=1 Tax=Nocardiopsis sp. LOL_012 TaxID=3345409 RepID=UPI003A8C7989
LAEVGRREEALAPAHEAVTIRRTLADQAPAAYLPNLATALNNLAIRLAEVGRREEALAAYDAAIQQFSATPAWGHFLRLGKARFCLTRDD